MQTYNYNAHTRGIGNSEFLSDKEVLDALINSGFTTIGFSEHLSNTPLELPEEDKKMFYSEINEYITSINKLKQENTSVNILSGFETEYDPMKEEFVGTIREKVDYMVLNQDTIQRGLSEVVGVNNPYYPIEYANMVINALDTGIFDILTCPDSFIKYRETMRSEEYKRLFDENSAIASQVICEKASVMGIPLQIDLSNETYPIFWQIASEIDGLKVLIGSSTDILNMNTNYNNKSNIISLINDKLLGNDYNPKVERENNQKLRQSFNDSQRKSLSYEALLSNEIMKSCLKDDNLVPSDLMEYVSNCVDRISQNYVESASQKDNSTLEDVTRLSSNENIEARKKLAMLDRKKKTINETNRVLANQKALMEKIKESVATAIKYGCTTGKDEIINIATQLIEHDTTLDEDKKAQIEMQVNRYSELKYAKESGGSSYRLTNPNYGFTNIALITLLLTFITGFGIGIAYALLSLK